MTITATISCTYCWRPGHGILRTLTDTGADVGYSRMEVGGSETDFRTAIELVTHERNASSGSHRTACTRLLQRLEGALAAH